MKDKIKVVISGLIYPMTMMRYFWDAFERRDDIELFVIGPFFNDWIPWDGGMRLPMRYVKVPHLPMHSHMINNVPAESILTYLQWKADLWIQFDAGFHFISRPFAEIVALVETDPHCLKHTYDLPKSYSDYTFCMQTPYMLPNEHYLPYAYDPTVHYPMPEVEKEYDVCLIGLHYPQRDDLVAKLRKRGVKVYYDLGLIFDEYREIINKSRIGINWSSMQDMNARVWELAAMKVCAVENRVPDMDAFFVDNDHYVSFKLADEATTKIIELLDNSEKRESIENAAYRKVVSGKHTYDDRVAQILRTVKLIA